MAKFPSMPLWTDAWLAATNHLTFEEKGIYMDMLVLMWRTPGCRIPADQAWIERHLRINNDQFDTIIKPIIDEFLDTTGNWVTSRRLQKEYLFVQDKAKKQSVRSKSRWSKEKRVSGGNATTPTLPAYATDDESENRNVLGNDTVLDSALITNEIEPSDGYAPIPIPREEKKKIPPVSPKKSAKRGSRIDPNWEPDDNLFAFAVDNIGMEKTNVEIEKFRDHFIAVAGAKGVKKDWAATWRNWIRRHSEFAGSNRPATASLSTSVGDAIAGGTDRQRLHADWIHDDQPDTRSGSIRRNHDAGSIIDAVASRRSDKGIDPPEGDDEEPEHGASGTVDDDVSLCG